MSLSTPEPAVTTLAVAATHAEWFH